MRTSIIFFKCIYVCSLSWWSNAHPVVSATKHRRSLLAVPDSTSCRNHAKFNNGIPDGTPAGVKIGDLEKIIQGQPHLDSSTYVTQFQFGLKGRAWIHLCLAFDGEQLVGYKLGRSDDPRNFESWHGGIHPDFRRQGIARELAQRQESWCRRHNFKFITTLTAHDNTPMLILNLRQGFIISGTFLKRGQCLNVVLEKRLT